jgi:predicted SnoaL-like aldol condensation-catalyzing enzyme
MNTKDPKLTALMFNECINSQDIENLSILMSEDHSFIDRDGNVHSPKDFMIKAWENFFKLFPDYKNTFLKLESRDDIVLITGSAYWSEENPDDSSIWVVKIEDDLVKEWRIYYNTDENRKLFNI